MNTIIRVLLGIVVLIASGCGSPEADGPSPCDPGRSGSDCVPCPDGSYCPGGPRDDALLYFCEDNTWDHDGDAATECIPHTECNSDEWRSAPGTTTRDVTCESLSECAPGAFISAPGTFASDRTCAPCPDGTFSTERSVTSCSPKTDCGPGTYTTDEGSTTEDRTCMPCASGTFSSEPHNDTCAEVSDCPAGTFVASDPSASSDRSCSMCPAGTYSQDANAATCVAWTSCDPGSYVEVAGTDTTDQDCTGCPSGTFSTTDNASNCASWTTCSPGEFVSDGGTTTTDRTCEACAPDTFSTFENASACVPQVDCAPGTVETAPGDSTTPAVCTSCNIGEYCAGGTTPPVTCSVGTWDHDSNPGTECVAWTTCIAGEYVVSDGTAITDRDCQNCSPSAYSTTENVDSCTPKTVCQPGEYIDVRGSAVSDRSCAACAAGTYTDSVNRSVCAVPTDCAPGTYEDAAPTISSDRICLTCPSDTFSTAVNVAQCAPMTTCLSDEWVRVPGTPTTDRICESCASGTETSVGPNATTCTFVAPGNTTDRVDVLAPGKTSCILLESNGRAVCWGANPGGLAENVPQRSFIDISTYKTFACGIRAADNRLECWGPNLPPIPAALANEKFVEITSGPDPKGFCAVRQSDGSMACFLGNELVSIEIPGTGFSNVVVGQYDTCALQAPDSSFECRLGGSGFYNYSFTGTGYKDLTIGYRDAAVVDSNNRIRRLGSSPPFYEFQPATAISQGRCLLSSPDNLLECPAAQRGGTFQDSTGAFDRLESSLTTIELMVCARRSADASPACWGGDGHGQSIGLPGDVTMAQVSSNVVSCALTSAGEIDCFGSTYYLTTDSGAPGGKPFATLASGDGVACATDAADDTVECWGFGPAQTVPSLLSFEAFDRLAVGSLAACGLRSADDAARCWGDATSEVLLQLPTSPNDQFATLVMPPTRDYALATRASTNDVVTWGDDAILGNTPTASMVDVSAEDRYACGIQSNGTIRCWGQAGDVATNRPTGAIYDQIATAPDFACARKIADKKLDCWGDSSIVSRLGGATNLAASSLDAHDSTVCVVTDGTALLRCFGDMLVNPR